MNGWQAAGEPGDLLERQVKIDPVTGDTLARQRHHGDDLEQALRLNSSFLNTERSTSSLWGGASQVRVASIPLSLVEDWMLNDGPNMYRWNDEDKSRLMKKLNDRDYTQLRTAGGRL